MFIKLHASGQRTCQFRFLAYQSSRQVLLTYSVFLWHTDQLKNVQTSWNNVLPVVCHCLNLSSRFCYIVMNTVQSFSKYQARKMTLHDSKQSLKEWFCLTVCAPGTEGDGVTCSDCILSYQPGGVPGNVTCTLCPPNTIAPDRATLASNCTGNKISFQSCNTLHNNSFSMFYMKSYTRLFSQINEIRGDFFTKTNQLNSPVRIFEFFMISDLAVSARCGRSKSEFFVYLSADTWYLKRQVHSRTRFLPLLVCVITLYISTTSKNCNSYLPDLAETAKFLITKNTIVLRNQPFKNFSCVINRK